MAYISKGALAAEQERQAYSHMAELFHVDYLRQDNTK